MARNEESSTSVNFVCEWRLHELHVLVLVEDHPGVLQPRRRTRLANGLRSMQMMLLVQFLHTCSLRVEVSLTSILASGPNGRRHFASKLARLRPVPAYTR